jgi:hypothetical protein
MGEFFHEAIKQENSAEIRSIQVRRKFKLMNFSAAKVWFQFPNFLCVCGGPFESGDPESAGWN